MWSVCAHKFFSYVTSIVVAIAYMNCTTTFHINFPICIRINDNIVRLRMFSFAFILFCTQSFSLAFSIFPFFAPKKTTKNKRNQFCDAKYGFTLLNIEITSVQRTQHPNAVRVYGEREYDWIWKNIQEKNKRKKMENRILIFSRIGKKR